MRQLRWNTAAAPLASTSDTRASRPALEGVHCRCSTVLPSASHGSFDTRRTCSHIAITAHLLAQVDTARMITVSIRAFPARAVCLRAGHGAGANGSLQLADAGTHGVAKLVVSSAFLAHLTQASLQAAHVGWQEPSRSDAARCTGAP